MGVYSKDSFWVLEGRVLPATNYTSTGTGRYCIAHTAARYISRAERRCGHSISKWYEVGYVEHIMGLEQCSLLGGGSKGNWWSKAKSGKVTEMLRLVYNYSAWKD